MSLPNPETVVTEERLNEFYTELLPYLGGRADAGFTPIGTIIPMIAETAPANYLICDGAAYNKSDYPELADHLLSMTNHSMYEVSGDSTKFKVPDLRGEFIRGAGTNSHANNGNGSAVGAHQDATRYPKIAQWGNAEIGFTGATGENTGITYADANVDSSSTAKIWKKMTVSGTAGTGGTDLLTFKPTNTSVLFCIATKNIYLNPSLDYSTDEKVVGTWIDGKTIYQKTIVDTMPEATTLGTIVSKDISVNANVDKFIDIKIMIKSVDTSNEYYIPLSNHGTVILSSGEFKEIFRTLGTNNNSVEARKNKISIRNGLPGWSGTPVYITIQYTKTTS